MPATFAFEVRMTTSPCPNPSPSTPKIAVLVDARPELNALLASLFEQPVWTVHHVSDNKAALEFAKARPFDLILTDERTSGREDVELLRRMRTVRPHTRLIILTDESTPGDVIASMRERAFSYFSTPYSTEKLQEMVAIATQGPCWDDGIEVLSATPEWISILCRCDVSTANRLLQFFREIADLPDAEKEEVATAFYEMLINAIEHGGRFDPSQYVEISYIQTRKMVMCRVKDPGEGFSLEELQHAAIANPPEDPFRHMSHRDTLGLRPGGFGVLLAKKLVDELIYGEKGNEVLLVKYIPPAVSSPHP